MKTCVINFAVAVGCLLCVLEFPSHAQDDTKTERPQSAIEVSFRESVDHFLSGDRLIRYTGPIDVVHLKIVVAPDGTVQAATPESVNTRWQDKAVSLAKTWRYVPFQIGGEPILATFSADVDVVPPESRPTQHSSSSEASFPEIRDWNSLRITLRRTRCNGLCPAYSLVISGDGTVAYDGYDYVQYCGELGGHVSQEVVQQLVSLFKKADYFNTFDRYAIGDSDEPTYTTSISFDDKSKSVVDYEGLGVGMPEAVLDIEEAIDRLAGPKALGEKEIYASFGIARPCPRSPLTAASPPSR